MIDMRLYRHLYRQKRWSFAEREMERLVELDTYELIVDHNAF